MILTADRKYLIPPEKMGGGFMKGSVHFNRDRWFVQVYWEGHRYQIYRYNDDPIWHEKTAKKLLSKVQAEIDDGMFEPRAYFPDSPISVQEYSERWLNLIDVMPNTLKDYRYSIRKFVIPFFGKKDLRKIRHMDLLEFYKSIERCEKGKYNVMSCLRTMMRWAWRNEDIQKVPPFPALSQGKLPDVEYLTMEQQERVLEAISERHRPIFQVGMEYGLRIGEMRAIMWDCITDEEIIIRRAFAENALMESTKTGKERSYGLTSYVRKILSALPVTSSTFAFVREDGKPYTDKNLNAIWHNACETAKIKRIKLYNAVRHSLGCQLLDEGVEMDIVRQQLGHSRPEMTMRYAKRSQAKLTNLLENRRAVIVDLASRLQVTNNNLTTKYN